MKFSPKNWTVATSVVAVQSALALTTPPLLAHDGHSQQSTTEQPAADSQPALTNSEPARLAEPGTETGSEMSPQIMPASPNSVSAETSPAPETTAEERPKLANVTGQIHLGLGELTFAVIMTGPFLLTFIKQQLRK